MNIQERQPADKWTVYGMAKRHPDSGWIQIGKELYTEDAGWQYFMYCRVSYAEMSAVLVHVTHREGKAHFKGKWRPVHKILLRIGGGKAWFE